MSAPRSWSSAPGRPGPTQKLDQGLLERFKSDPKAFQRGTTRNLLVVIALLALGALLSFVGLHTVGITGGGLAVVTMGIFPILLALAALDEVRWRRALVARGGVPPPPFRFPFALRGSRKKEKLLPSK
ncbi:MAG: hypothetical protein KGJ23_03245 [Euryarchaeota archaeon]|nr:hypothetical protein [Euryarchaeota archaeon]MDE1835614.1 hypothetical protein [Euryarchaeota archaeon]MDE1878962.1 hypothetical protein [Euryarchaeota archaeon]MDE2043764.1 hypothetical protein [Thermoplasmata archaeon]